VPPYAVQYFGHWTAVTNWYFRISSLRYVLGFYDNSMT
jgi:hypothetical protein